MSNDWEDIFPLTVVSALNRILSDHAPLLLDSGVCLKKDPMFRFESCRLTRDGIKDIIQGVWGATPAHLPILEKWQWILRNLRKKLKGWNRNVDVWYRKLKKEISAQINGLDLLAESGPLSYDQRELKKDLDLQLNRLMKQEELKWQQRSKEKDLVEGDNNTKFFHAKANGRRRKNLILSLEQDEGKIKGEEHLMTYITDFYKKLFEQSSNTTISLELDNICKLRADQTEALIVPFTMEELKGAVFQMEKNKSPGPDGFPAEFYQEYWEIVKNDLFSLLYEFYFGQLKIDRLNYGIITLVPKCKEAKQIQKFRPICLLNVSFKIITKVLMNRLAGCVRDVISATQTTFLKGRYIMEGVMVLHEALNFVHIHKQSAVLFKVDFEKAYDKIKWPFVYQMLKLKGFPDCWCDWMMNIMTGGKVCVRVNDRFGPYFPTYTGLRQGDPMSPLLFDLAADALAMILDKANKSGLIKGIIPELVNRGINILQYADDTIFLIQDDMDSAKNLKFALCAFEQMSGLKINFHKSDLYCLGEAHERVDLFSAIFTCKMGELPLTYLGIPVDAVRIRNRDWKRVENKVENRLSCWQGKILSAGGRNVLINS